MPLTSAHVCTYYCRDGLHAVECVTVPMTREALLERTRMHFAVNVPDLEVVDVILAREVDAATWNAQSRYWLTFARVHGQPTVTARLPSPAQTQCWLVLVRVRAEGERDGASHVL